MGDDGAPHDHVNSRHDSSARWEALDAVAHGRLRHRGPWCVHYWWLVKADVRGPLAYAAVIALLLTFRVYWKWAHAVPAAVQRAPLGQSATGARKAS